ncbi:FMN-binding negative transcriptional regulator [Hyphococcus formosus]|uniref:FMN-binding negative transcriptional regulator n=1 Tax=Hyphococcus formosus TaxID=3143534 RepID=UPI00398AB046
MPSIFEHYDDNDISALIAEYPLAWVQPIGDEGHKGALLPLIAELNADGALSSLIGHMARKNPLHDALKTAGEASILFQGPQAYVSPSWIRKPDWAPTWNYARVSINAKIEFEALSIDEALERLAKFQEDKQNSDWTISQIGERYKGLAEMVIPFRASVRSVRGVFKLGQDENDEVFSDIVEHMSDPSMVQWMRRFRER